MDEIKVEAILDNLQGVVDFIEKKLEDYGFSMKFIMNVDVVVDEIMANIVDYAYPKEPGMATVKISKLKEENGVVIEFSDQGIPYNPLLKEDPDITLSADERPIGGLGIFMIKQMMDKVEYRYEDNSNILTVYKSE